MRTVVFQSFRTDHVPAWIAACLDSVKSWAALQGFDYRFFDDRFFELVPPDVRRRASAHKCILADYARLVAARDLLSEGWQRAIWLDADVVVFAPSKFTISTSNGYAFCREVWLDRIVLGQPHFNLTVNNAVSVFCQDQTIIDFYLDAANTILRSSDPLSGLSIGTNFLLKLHRASRFPLLTTVGNFGPEMICRYLKNDGNFLRPCLDFQTSPIFAANLCLSHITQGEDVKETASDPGLHEDALLRFIARLRADEGESLNHWFTHAYQPHPDEFDRPLSRLIGAKRAMKSLVIALRLPGSTS